MKGLVCVALLLISMAAVNSRSAIDSSIKELTKEKVKGHVGELNECEICLNIVDNLINEALNIILNIAVAETCQVGCMDVAQKFFNGSENEEKIADMLCTLLCLAGGIKGFVDILEKIDIDPIYYCEKLSFCDHTENGSAKIDQVIVSPLTGAQGTTFDVEVDFTVINTTGTADILMYIHTVDKIPLEGEFMLFQEKPNKYTARIKVNATPNDDCQTICEQWLPGNYIIDIYLCEGQCHGKHPYHKIYDLKHGNFTITGQ